MSIRALRRWLAFSAIIAAVVIASCAKIGVPPGGPEDKTGPTLVNHYPEINAVNVSRRMTAKLQFSEPVNRTTIETALFLSPDPRQRLRYHWSGNTLELVYLDSLDKDRTYVISIGSQARDLRGNPSGTTYTVAFSTGSQIDRGHIRGWIDGADVPQAINLWAYRLDEDSLCDPLTTVADYVVQADEKGQFDLNYLKTGRYRVFAIQDRNHDGLWTPPGELIGIPPWDADVADSAASWLSLNLSQQDTAAAQIRTSRAVNSFQVDLRMNRDVVSLAGYFINPGGDSLPILTAYPDTSGMDQWIAFAPKALDEGVCRMAAQGVDLFGKTWSDSDTFEVKARSDTSRPKLLHLDPPANSKSRIPPENIRLTFNEPITVDTAYSLIFLLLAADTDSVNLKASLRENHIFELQPDEPLRQAMTYRLIVNGHYIHDGSGNTYQDSTVAFRFQMWPDDSLGTLIGRIAGVDAGDFIVNISGLRDGRSVATVRVRGSGEIRMDRLPPVQYILDIVRDDDGSGSLSYGQMRPFQFSEPFWASSDTVVIRARWEYETRINWPLNP